MAKLDETGLDIAGCRHAIAQFSVNMFQGELYGYAHYILCNKLMEKPLDFFWQDIICKSWNWACNCSPELAQSNIKPALSLMHAKAHNWTCQVCTLFWSGIPVLGSVLVFLLLITVYCCCIYCCFEVCH